MMNDDEGSQAANVVADSLLLALDGINVNSNVAQAALGSAWFRLCQAMKFDKYQFKEMCQGMVEAYEPYEEEI